MHLVSICIFLVSFLFSVVSGSEIVTTVPLERPCPELSFRCHNTSELCVAQAGWCDKDVQHCPGGEDEAFDGCRHKAAIDNLIKEQVANKSKHSPDLNKCEFDDYDTDVCQCRGTQLICSNRGLTRLPTPMPANVTKLYFEHNSLSELTRGMFGGMPYLQVLNLINSSIRILHPGAFEGLQHLSRLFLDRNLIEHIPAGVFVNLPKLDMLHVVDNRIKRIDKGALSSLPILSKVNLHMNQIELNSNEPLPFPPSIVLIDLGRNHLQTLSQTMFSKLTSLQILMANQNRLESIERGTFDYQQNLLDLNISHNQLKKIDGSMLNHTTRLNNLDMSHNPLKRIPESLFYPVPELSQFNVEGITIENISPEMFLPVQKLKHVKFKYFGYCRYTPRVRDCSPKGDGISSIENLLDLAVLRGCIWVVGLITCLGNMIVFFGRVCVKKEDNQTHFLFIINLCAADFLMGIYLLVIAAHDIKFRDQYNLYANMWLTSIGCQATGFIAMVSSEVSILLLSYMSLERFLTIVYPYKMYNVSLKVSAIAVALLWVAGFVLAAVPLLSEATFGRFYGTNGVCFPLHIHDPFMQGWQYSAFVFLGLDFVAMCVITFCYAGMFISIMKTRKHAATAQNGDMAFAKRFFLIVFTDALCWFPIIIIKLLAFGNITISNEAYAWVVIFVLPVNSALNPIMYSLASISFRRRMSRCFVRQTSRLTQRFKGVNSDGKRRSRSGSKTIDTSLTAQEHYPNGFVSPVRAGNGTKEHIPLTTVTPADARSNGKPMLNMMQMSPTLSETAEVTCLMKKNGELYHAC